MVVKDIKLIWDADIQEGEIVFDPIAQDLESDNTFETAIIISLFSDRRAKKDDILPDPNSDDRRGWWGDLASPEATGDRIGSRLWLLNREKTLEDVLVRAKEYTKEALQWLIDDGAAINVRVETERQGSRGNAQLAIGVKILKIDGESEAFNFEAQWVAQFAA